MTETPASDFVAIGRVLAPWGNQGKVKIEVITDFPERFTPSARVCIDQEPATIESVHRQKGTAVIKLDTVNSREEAELLRGKLVEIPESELKPLPEGQYYQFQLIGLEVWTTQGELLGEVTEILSAPANDVYVVQGDAGENLLPAIEDVVKTVDLEKGRIVIEPIPGLLNPKREPKERPGRRT